MLSIFNVGAFHGAWEWVWLRTVKLLLGVGSAVSLWELLVGVGALET